MTRIVFFASIFLLVSLSPCGHALDIGAYEIVQRDGPPGVSQQWTLQFLDSNIAIPLVPTKGAFYSPGDEFSTIVGADGIQVQWLIVDEVLWVSWRTVPMGSGSYYDAAHIIVDVANGFTKELRRADYPANGRQGGDARQHLDIVYTYEERTDAIVETLTRHDMRLLEHPFPLAVKHGNFGYYRLEEHLTQVTRFSIRKTGLGYGGATQALELGDEEKPAEEVARYVILKFFPRFLQRENLVVAVGEITPSEVERVLTELRMARGFNEDRGTLTGKIALPYVAGAIGNPRSPTEEGYIFAR